MRESSILAAALLFACLSARAGPTEDPETELRFANGLRDLRYYELAIERFRTLNWPQQKDPEFRVRVAEGLIETHMAASKAASRTTDALREVRRGVAELTRLIETQMGESLRNRLLMRRGRMLLQEGRLGREVYRYCPKGIAPADVAARAEKVFNDAVRAFENALDGYKKDVKRIEAKSRVDDADRRLRREMLSQQVTAETEVGWARLRLGQFQKELKKEKEFRKEIQAAAKIFQDVTIAYPELVAAVDATLGKALCSHELGEHQKAIATFDKVLKRKPSKTVAMIRFEAYDNKARSQTALRDYDGALDTLKTLRREFRRLPTALDEALQMHYARILGEAADGLQKQTRQNLAQAVTLSEKGDPNSKRAAARLRDKGIRSRNQYRRLYAQAVEEVRKLAASDSPYAQEANLLMGRWAEAALLKTQRAAALLFAQGEHLLATGRPAEAIAAYRKVVQQVRDTGPDQKLAHDAWIQMGKAYAEQKQYYEAGLALGHAARLFPDSEQAERAAVYSAMLLGAQHKLGRTPFESETYLESQKLLADRFPHLPVAKRAAFRLGDLRREQKRYEEAAHYYGKVDRASEYYERASYLLGWCLWQAFLDKRQPAREPAALHPLSERAKKQLRTFVAWAEQQPHAPPEVEKARRLWIAAAKVLLAEISLHQNRPQDVLNTLTDKALAGFRKVLAEFDKLPPGQEGLIARARLHRLKAHCALTTIEHAQNAGEEMQELRKEKHLEPRLKSAAARLVGTTFVKLAKDLKESKPPGTMEREFRALCTNARIYLILAIELNTEQALDDYKQIATDLYTVGMYNESAHVFNLLVKRFADRPEHANVIRDARRWTGTCYKKADDWQKAMTVFEALVKEFPRWIDVRRDLAECYANKHVRRYADAEEQWRTVEETLRMGTADWFKARYHRIEALVLQTDRTRKDLAFQILAATIVSHPKLGGPESEGRFMALLEQKFDRQQRERLLKLRNEALQPAP